MVISKQTLPSNFENWEILRCGQEHYIHQSFLRFLDNDQLELDIIKKKYLRIAESFDVTRII